MERLRGRRMHPFGSVRPLPIYLNKKAGPLLIRRHSWSPPVRRVWSPLSDGEQHYSSTSSTSSLVDAPIKHIQCPRCNIFYYQKVKVCGPAYSATLCPQQVNQPGPPTQALCPPCQAR